MKSIWKYTIEGGSYAERVENEIDLPEGAKVLSAGVQGDKICLWALVDPDARTEVHRFRVFPTGYFIGERTSLDIEFIGTVQLENGLVFHVFEEKF